MSGRGADGQPRALRWTSFEYFRLFVVPLAVGFGLAFAPSVSAIPAPPHCPALLFVAPGPEDIPARRATQAAKSEIPRDPAPSTVAFEQWETAALRETRYISAEAALELESQAIEATRNLLAERRIQFAEKYLKDATHPTFHLLPVGNMFLNRLSEKLVRDLPGVQLVYSPTALMRGSAGFFSENDSAIGISHGMFARGAADETFHHEVIHAAHFLGRKGGELDPLNPYAKLLVREPGRSIGKSRKGYTHLQTFEEIEAYVESVAIDSMRLQAYVGRRLSHAEWDQAEDILNAIYFQCDTGIEVGRQTRELATVASSAKAWATDSGWVAIPERPSFWRRTLRLDAYTAELAGQWTLHPEGTEFVWRISAPTKPAIGPDELRAMLEKSLLAANLIEGGFAQIKSQIFWMIERADARKSKLQAVIDAADELDRLFHAWKRNHGVIGVPTLFDGR